MTEQPQELRVGYHRDLDAITRRWCGSSRWCREAVAAANEALLGDDTEALAAVRAGEKTIDELMAELEADIERLLLLQAPVAGELRYALAIIRIVPELERSGDLAEHIAKRAGSGPGRPAHPDRPRDARADGHPRRRALAGGGRRLHRSRPGRPARRSRRPTTRSTTSTPRSPASSSPAALPAGVAADATLVARFYERLGDHAVHIAARVANAVA